jgi:hypothetical protein
MKMNYFKLFKDKDTTHHPAAQSIIAEGAGIRKEGNEDKGPGTTSAKPSTSNRMWHRVTGPRCVECGWSKS